MVLEDRFLIKNSPFEESPENYHFLLNNFGADFSISLYYNKKGKVKNIANILMGLFEESIHCYNIQGVKGFYRELTPIRWDSALLNESLNVTEELGLKEISVLPWYKVKGDDLYMKQDKLKKRYDYNALSFGFEFDKERGLYIKKLN